MSASSVLTNSVHSRTVLIAHSEGLHMRPCSAIVDAVSQHRAKVTVQHGNQSTSGTSMLGLLSLAATQGNELVLYATGPEAEEVLETLAALLTGPREPAEAK